MAFYGPPPSDSDDDYDGFVFGDNLGKKTQPLAWTKELVVDVDQELQDAAIYGDLETLKKHVEDIQFDVNEILRDGRTLLLLACKNAHLHVVRYLLEQKEANANRAYSSYTPLMMACEVDTEKTETAKQIAQLLLHYKANVGYTDMFGVSAFMRACQHGHAGIVQLLAPLVDINDADNAGNTPLCYAIENNRPDIVQQLVQLGAVANQRNGKGYTAYQVAEMHGFYDMLELLPKKSKEEYIVPTALICYNTVRDYIPRVFLKSGCPEYFPEVYNILSKANLGNTLEYFARANISLGQFLCLSEQDLQQIGIKYPYLRQRIMKTLLDFHLHHWSGSSVAQWDLKTPSFYRLLMIVANQIMHVVIINATLRYIEMNYQVLGTIPKNMLLELQDVDLAYHQTIKQCKKTTRVLANLSPPRNPLFIDYDEIVAERKRKKVRRYVKYTSLVVGFSIYVCLKLKKLF